MHLRFSACIGTPVVEDGSGEALGEIADVLIYPDTGKIEGFFVRLGNAFAGGETLFLSTLDIARWGTAAHVRHPEALCPPEEIVRIAPLLHDPRRVLRQRMTTEDGRRLGRCADVQLDTEAWQIEWLFPRAWLRWGIPVSVKDVVDVQREAIIVRDPEAIVREKEIHAVSSPVSLPDVVVPQPQTRS